MERSNRKIDKYTNPNKDNSNETQKEELVDALKQELEEKILAGNIEAFGMYIMQYYTKNEDGELQINLPAKGEFKGFNFKCKIRDLRIFLNEETSYEGAELGKKIANLLHELENYLKAYGREMDEYKIQDFVLNPIFKKYHIQDRFTETDEEV